MSTLLYAGLIPVPDSPAALAVLSQEQRLTRVLSGIESGLVGKDRDDFQFITGTTAVRGRMMGIVRVLDLVRRYLRPCVNANLDAIAKWHLDILPDVKGQPVADHVLVAFLADRLNYRSGRESRSWARTLLRASDSFDAAGVSTLTLLASSHEGKLRTLLTHGPTALASFDTDAKSVKGVKQRERFSAMLAELQDSAVLPDRFRKRWFGRGLKSGGLGELAKVRAGSPSIPGKLSAKDLARKVGTPDAWIPAWASIVTIDRIVKAVSHYLATTASPDIARKLIRDMSSELDAAIKKAASSPISKSA